MGNKQDLLALIRRMREDVTEEEVIETLLFRHQVKKGLEDVAAGRTITHAEFQKRIRKWRKSAGR